MYFDAQGRLRGMLLSWTSLGGTDLLRMLLLGDRGGGPTTCCIYRL